MLAYYGSTVKFDSWDASKTKEFGYHFGLENSQDSVHRISKSGGYLYKVDISWKNAVKMDDPFFWNLKSILSQLGLREDYERLKKLAVQRARKKGSSLRAEENLIAAESLNKLGYDAIVYKNKAENSGDAAISWRSDQIKVISVSRLLPTN